MSSGASPEEAVPASSGGPQLRRPTVVPLIVPRSARTAQARSGPAVDVLVSEREPVDDVSLDPRPPAPSSGAQREPGRAAKPAVTVPSIALTILGALLLGFVVNLSIVGDVRHIRDQQTAFAELRRQLAEGVAPVGQTDDDGKLYPLGTAMGVLEIPALSLREVFFEGTSSGVLRSGPGHRRDSPLPGQAGTSVIFGRKAAYGAPFRSIDRLANGQQIIVTTGLSRVTYRVLRVRRAGDPQLPALQAGQGRLTLVTAAGGDYLPSGTVRVDAALTSTVQPSNPRPLGAASLPASERPLAGDLGAVLPLALWAQLLALLALAVTWARYRWGRRQVWLAGLAPLVAVTVGLSDQAARLLPNLL